MTWPHSYFGHNLARLIFGARALPKIWRQCPWTQLPMLAVDLELTSLDPKSTAVVSVASVAGRGGEIDLGSCRHQLVHTAGDLAQSPAIHGITQSQLDVAPAPDEALECLFGLAQSHVWVMHNAALDMAALAKAAKAAGLLALLQSSPVTIIDTLALRLYQLRKSHAHTLHHPVSHLRATLSASVKDAALPAFKAHSALDDAVATLQLVFTQLNTLDPGGSQPLGKLWHTRAISVY
jgi:DNA polymerase-3 subunit epsilon